MDQQLNDLRSALDAATDTLTRQDLNDKIARLLAERAAMQSGRARKHSHSMMMFHLDAASCYAEELGLQDAQQIVDKAREYVTRLDAK